MAVSALAMVGDCLLDLLYPETCVECGLARGSAPWSAAGPRVPGLRPWDRPHMCLACGWDLQARPGRCDRIVGESLSVWGGDWTRPGLVTAVGLWKYHGVRGLAWPLAGMLGAPAAAATAALGSPGLLVPVPLHPARRRQRGFNQAEVLARLLGSATGLPVAADVLRRVRPTRQQAKLAQDGDRARNVAGAFRVVAPDLACPPPRVAVVDDLVTSGATVAAAAAALRRVGWEVAWAVCLGLARPAEGRAERVDTRGDAP